MDGWSLIHGRNDFSLVHSVQISFGAHPAFRPMSTRGEVAEHEVITNLHLVLRSGIVELYLYCLVWYLIN
jgi:hypothetical protein